MFRLSRLVQSIAWFAVLLCLTTVAKGATVTDSTEVEALQDIAAALGKKDWDFTVDPCSGQSPWVEPKRGDFENNVTCGNCSFDANTNNTVCHVISILLKAQSLPGTLPPDFSRLPYLQFLDLSRNFLNGTLPPKWSSLPLVLISVIGNRLTGGIPKEFGNMSTLEELVVEMNQLSGNLSSELGNLPRIKRLLFTSNNFTGELPTTFAKLTTLTDIRLGDNQFNGTIPAFIENWTSLTKLVIQASGFQSPIPSGIQALANLNDLRISDLNGPEAPFPQLNTSSPIKTLILRNCNLTGTLPDYLAQMTSLKDIDLSFNRLSGPIPPSYSSLVKASTLFLTGNMLNGSVPEWMTSKGKNIDLSYNNLSIGAEACQVQSVNLFASSSAKNNLGIYSCLKSTCSKKHYSLYINCGGRAATVGSNYYEADDDTGSPSRFYESTNWAYSNTGFFPDNSRDTDIFIWQNTLLDVKEAPELYTDARLSPLALTYYGYCLLDKSYNVSLHFAEIMFSAGANYSSLGRRIFDVYIQGKRVLEDFNIVEEAGGVGKDIVKTFTVDVTNSTLEIRLLWTGKGTTAIPTRSVFGPLISAISVNPNFPIPKNPGSGSKISAGVVTAIVVSVIFAVFLIVGILWWKGCLFKKDTMDEDLRGLDFQTGSFTLRQIKAATNNFDAANKIGEGGFGPVYRGQLLDGTVIAVKQLSAKSKQGNREFINEIGMISALQHPHLVKLYGCCIEGNQLLLVYEYLENNSLARALFGKKEHQLNLDWRTRHKICVGIARGLAYLHEESRLKIVHRDIKATNVLLDKNLLPKISDFGLAKLDEEDNTHISTRVAGTFGYMAPEYALRGYLTDKADVYSFGIVALEIISGRSNTSYRPKEESFFLLDWAHFLKERGDLMDLVDPRLGSEFNKEEVVGMISVALLCTHVSPSVRPTMSAVVSMLEGKANVPAAVPENSVINDAKIAAMKKHFKGEDHDVEINEKKEENQSQLHNHSTYSEGPWTGSSTSANDLYPIIADSDYWKNRD